MSLLKSPSILALVTILSATPVLAEVANFQTLTLSPGFKSSAAVVRGYTNGSYSLSAIANRDRHKNPCIGFGSPKPDHIMVLEKDFPQLTVQVDSKGKDTTLVIQGPDGSIRCGDDTGRKKDASVQDTDWKAGRYSIWIGSIEAGQTWNYNLSAHQ
jgi:hypothetical protein